MVIGTTLGVESITWIGYSSTSVQGTSVKLDASFPAWLDLEASSRGCSSDVGASSDARNHFIALLDSLASLGVFGGLFMKRIELQSR